MLFCLYDKWKRERRVRYPVATADRIAVPQFDLLATKEIFPGPNLCRYGKFFLEWSRLN